MYCLQHVSKRLEKAGAVFTLRIPDLTIRMKETYAKGDILRDLARAQAKTGDFIGANSAIARIEDKHDGARYAYKEEALAAIGDASAVVGQTQLLTDIQKQARTGGATNAQASVKTWTTPLVATATSKSPIVC